MIQISTGGADQNRTGVNGFADHRVPSPPQHRTVKSPSIYSTTTISRNDGTCQPLLAKSTKNYHLTKNHDLSPIDKHRETWYRACVRARTLYMVAL